MCKYLLYFALMHGGADSWSLVGFPLSWVIDLMINLSRLMGNNVSLSGRAR